ncbi:Nif3-like dinuclear metal center hexameric protein [Leucobacter sp. GX24907]
MTETFALHDLVRVAETMWPGETAEDWDRVGLVSGSGDTPLRRVLLAVDAVSATVDEAIDWGADALFVHHPLLLRGIHTVAEDTAKGALLARLIRAGCALFAAHTNADQPRDGVSDVIGERLGLEHSEAIVASARGHALLGDDAGGIGRVGMLREPIPLRAFAEQLADTLPPTVSGARVSGDPEQLVQHVALLGGAGDSLLDHPRVRAADVYVTSDLRHHPAQDSRELSAVRGGPALIDIAHWASESLWLDGAAARLRAALPGVDFRVSSRRTDPWDFSVGARSEV